MLNKNISILEIGAELEFFEVNPNIVTQSMNKLKQNWKNIEGANIDWMLSENL